MLFRSPDDRDRDRDAWRRGGEDPGRDQWRRDPPPARSEGLLGVLDKGLEVIFF